MLQASQHLVREWSWNEVEKCWELMKNGQIDGDEGNDEVGKECDDESEVKDMDEDDQHVGNDDDLLDGQVSDDEDSADEVDQLIELEPQNNLDVTDSQGDKLNRNRKMHLEDSSTSTQTFESIETLSLQQQQPQLPQYINEEYDEKEDTLQCNEKSSQHLVRECRIYDAEGKVDDEMESIESSIKEWTWNEVEKCWELRENGQIDGDEGNDEVGEECDDGESEVEEMDGDDEHGVHQLNGHEHRENVDGAETPEVQRPSNMNTSLTTAQCRASVELLNDQNNEHTNQTVLTNSIESVPSPSHRHNIIPVFASKSYPKDHKVAQFNKSSNQSSLYNSQNYLSKQELREDDVIEGVGELLEKKGDKAVMEGEVKKNEDDDFQVDACDSDATEVDDMDGDVHHVINDGQLEDSQVIDDEDKDEDGVERLNGLDHGSNIEGAETHGNQFSRNMPSGQVAVTDKSPTGKHVCDYCGRTFKKSSDLKTHTRTHTGEKPFKCPFDNCNKTFAQKSNMKTHYKSHTGGYPHVYERCGKRSQSRAGLVIHIRTHTGEKPFKCPFNKCNRTFAEKNNMKTHHMSHTGQYSHVCAHCSKGFRTQSELRIHNRSHTGEKPFKCPVENCNKKFSKKDNMKMHQMSHTGQYPHACAHCSKSFRSPAELNIHNRIHTGEKPFKCNWKDCVKRFISNKRLKIHFRTHDSTVAHSIQSVKKGKN